MKHSTPLPPLLLVAVLGLSPCLAFGQAKEPAAATPTGGTPNPVYPIPYATPTIEQVTEAMGRVGKRVFEQSPTRFVNKAGEEAKDLSKPDPNVTLDSGPEHRFPPIAYPMGVIYSGMLSAGEATGDTRYNEFVAKRFEFFATHLKEMEGWGAGRENPFRNFFKPGNLDACGAMVASMVKAKRMKVGTANVDPIIETAADYVHNKQQRLDDKTFCRPGPYPQSLWLDDAYMSVPLLANYAAVTGKAEYFDDAATQITGFYKHLFVKERGLFTHAGNMGNPDDHPIYCWGRANGWFMVATVELLELLPKDHPKRAEIIDILKAHAKGVASVQSGMGLWHQLLDREDSYLETSVTAMFTYSMAKAVNNGWLDARTYAPVAVSGWNGLTTKLGKEGQVNDVCIGTNYAQDMVYYYHRPAVDDIHGYGPVLLAGSEMIHLLKNPHVKFGNPGKSNANLVQAPRE